jgi:formyltetrahydrofolate deformylase
VTRSFVLTLSCPDRLGIVHAVSGFLSQRGCNIVDSHQFGDRDTNRFFMRVQFETDNEHVDLDNLRIGFTPVGGAFAMDWSVHDPTVRSRVLVLVSRLGHCLNDLVYRSHTGALNIEITGVVSNHTDLEKLAVAAGLPYHHVPVTAGTKAAAEARLLELVEAEHVDLVVLARYMQVLSADVCRRLEGRIINIHHSFLPGFKGARPYHQAHDHGVKLIGATAHYVTADLDEGPIIEQEVARVDHSYPPEALAAVGRDMECLALARAVRWHAEHRILLNGHRTVVFR